MEREIIQYTDEAAWLANRAQDITSTGVAALFNESPYLTTFELWHRLKNQEVVTIADTDRMKWGRRLQDVIAEGVAEDQALTIRPMKEYIRIPALRIGSSFDYMINEGSNPGILEIKNVGVDAYARGWTDDEAPTHIEIQLQHQMEVADVGWGLIAALVGGNQPVIFKRERDKGIGQLIRAKSAAFWKSIEDNKPPKPDYLHDAAFIAKLYGFSEPGKVYDARGDASVTDWCIEYKQKKATIDELEKETKAIKARLLERIQDSEKVLVDGFSISAGMIGPTHVEYDRAGYRDFRITAKKAAKGKAA